MKTSLKTFNLILVSILLTAVQPIWAKQQNDCGQKQKEVFLLATNALNQSATLSSSQKNTAIEYDRAAKGPRPGRIAQAEYLAKLDVDNQRRQTLILQHKDLLKTLLISASECFSEMTTEDLISISENLAE